MGMHLNAYTSREQTVYFAKCFKHDVGVAMDILSDILLHSSLAPKAVENERGVIVREMEEVAKQHEEVIMDYLHEAAYTNSGLGMTILGPEDNIRGLKQQQFRDYIDTHYTAPRMVVCGAGAVDHAELVELAKQYWGQLPVEPRTSYPTNFDAAVFSGGEKRQFDNTVNEAHISVAFEGTSWTSPEAFPLMLIQSILGNWDRLSGAGAQVPSPLAQTLAEQDLVHSFNTLNISYKDTGLFGKWLIALARSRPVGSVQSGHSPLLPIVNCFFAPLCLSLDPSGIYIIGDQDKMADALSATALQVQRLGRPGGVSKEVLERAQTQLKASLMQQLGTFSYICEDLGRQLLTYGRRMSTGEVFARIEAVTLEDIQLCAKRFTDGSQDVAVGALGTIDGVPDYEFINGVFLKK